KDKRGIVLAIFRQPGTNTIQVVDDVKKLLPTFRAEVPPAIAIEVLYDRSQTIRASVEEVQFTLVVALALVVMVIFLFLRNVAATIIPTLALPMCIVGTFSVMYLLGFSLDNISLMALTLCVGFVVDDAIVMLENITRHIEGGKSVMQATLVGSKEIVFTIISMTISLAEGLLALGGRRPDLLLRRGPAGHLLRCDGDAAAPGRRDRAPGSERRRRDVLRRRGGHLELAQHRAHHHQPQALRPEKTRRAGGARAAAQGLQHPRRQGVH